MHCKDTEIEHLMLACENLQIFIGDKTCTYITLDKARLDYMWKLVL